MAYETFEWTGLLVYLISSVSLLSTLLLSQANSGPIPSNSCLVEALL